jgi:uncharacterized lipoprotein YajG
MEIHKISSSMVLFVALLASAGCKAYILQQANIAPTVTVVSSSEGTGVAVAVRVTDERPSKSLGRRGTGIFGDAAEITAAQDLAAVVHKEIINGLKKKGFAAFDDSGAPSTKLSVEVRLLEYSTSTGFFTGGVHIKGALKAVASKNGKTYEKMYRTETEKRVVIVPTADTNEKWINEALGDMLKQLLDDVGLTIFLIQENG